MPKGGESTTLSNRTGTGTGPEPTAIPDLREIAKANLPGLSEPEIQGVVAVLEPLLRECREGFRDRLWAEHPAGTFHAGGT
ncbi:MAG: hypothetical protein OXN89_07620 [Bryobacterales bacterium]|nr:hypothetical protein [Bryobacterales bacterium]